MMQLSNHTLTININVWTLETSLSTSLSLQDRQIDEFININEFPRTSIKHWVYEWKYLVINLFKEVMNILLFYLWKTSRNCIDCFQWIIRIVSLLDLFEIKVKMTRDIIRIANKYVKSVEINFLNLNCRLIFRNIKSYLNLFYTPLNALT